MARANHIVKISQLIKLMESSSRLLSPPHEVGECALSIAGLRNVDNVNIIGVPRLFMAKS